MSTAPKSLMTQYAEGQLVGRELNDMMTDYAAQVRFDREMVDDFDTTTGQQWGKYARDPSLTINQPMSKRGIIKEGLEP